jgi:peptidoglycan/LPS O-acetylase OafA/YrhL
MTAYSKHRVHVLDGRRGMAALMVVVYYSFSPSEFVDAFVGVDLFFVLSGLSSVTPTGISF